MKKEHEMYIFILGDVMYNKMIKGTGQLHVRMYYCIHSLLNMLHLLLLGKLGYDLMSVEC